MGTRIQRIGLDIGSAFARAAWVSPRGAGFRIDRLETLALPPSGADTAVLRPWIEQIGLAGASCTVGLPGAQCMFQPFRLPPSDPRTSAQAAAMEVFKYSEMVAESVVHGFTVFEPAPGDRRMLLAMAQPEVVQNRLTLARDLGVRVVDLVPMPVAWFRGLRMRNAPGPAAEAEVSLYICIGGSMTELAVGCGGDLLFARAFPAGGNLFTERLARAADLPVGRAERTKRDEGSLSAGAPHAEALQGAAEVWAGEIAACLSVYRSLYAEPGWRIKRIVLAGGSAGLRGLPAWIQERLGLPVEAVPEVESEDGRIPGAVSAAAAGLAEAGGAEAGAAGISLLPESVRHEILFRRQKPYWIAAGAAGAAILGVSLLGGYRDFRRKAHHLTAQQVSLHRRQQIAADIERIKAQEEVLRTMVAPVQSMLRSGPLLRDLVTLLAEAQHEDDWISMVSDAATYFGITESREDSAPVISGRRRGQRTEEEEKRDDPQALFIRRILVEGYTRQPNLSTVRDLIARLSRAEWVRSADLLGDDALPPGQRTPAASGPVRRFVIDVEVMAP